MQKSTSFKQSLLSILFLFVICACADAQSYSSPESVEFDYANNRWFISNNGNGQILTRNSATGALAVFATGIPSGPHGLEIVGDTLYVCDGGALKAYDINTASQVFNISLGASFLNGITHDNNGYLYITDFSAYKIYRFNTVDRTFSVFVSNTGTSSPNGIIFDAANNRCIYVNWGANAPIKAVDLTNGTVSTITSTSLGSCDGIASDLNGNYYVSSWSGGSKITRFSNNFTTSTAVVTTGLSSPADIFYNVLTDTLGVPNSGSGNNTAYYYFGNSTGISESNTEVIEVDLIFNADELIVGLDQICNATWRLIDLNGRIAHAGRIKSAVGFNVSMKDVPASNYTIQIHIGSQILNRSFTWIR